MLQPRQRRSIAGYFFACLMALALWLVPSPAVAQTTIHSTDWTTGSFGSSSAGGAGTTTGAGDGWIDLAGGVYAAGSNNALHGNVGGVPYSNGQYLVRPSSENVLNSSEDVYVPMSTSSDTYAALRYQGNNTEYLAGISDLSSQTIPSQIKVYAVVNGTITEVGLPTALTTVPTAGDVVRFTSSAAGSNPTTITVSVFDVTQSISLGNASFTDSTSGLQVAGQVGLMCAQGFTGGGTGTINKAVTYNTSGSSPVTYSASDPYFRFTGHWAVVGGTATAINTGSIIDFKVIGSDTCTLNFTVSGDSANCIPRISYSVDGGSVVGPSAVAATVPLTISTSTGSHAIRVYADGIYEGAGGYPGTVDQWNSQQAALVFTGATFTSGASLTFLPTDPDEIEFDGDSITAGVILLGHGTSGQQGYYDQYAMESHLAWPQTVASHFAMDPVVVGFGSTGPTVTGSGGVPITASSQPYDYSGVAYYPRKAPKAIVLLLGTNDKSRGSTLSSFQAAYVTLLAQIRASRGAVTPIFVIAPPYFDSTWTTGLQATVSGIGDGNIHFIDTHGSIAVDTTNTINSSDGVHFTIVGGNLFAAYVEPLMASYLTTFSGTKRRVQ